MMKHYHEENNNTKKILAKKFLILILDMKIKINIKTLNKTDAFFIFYYSPWFDNVRTVRSSILPILPSESLYYIYNIKQFNIGNIIFLNSQNCSKSNNT